MAEHVSSKTYALRATKKISVAAGAVSRTIDVADQQSLDPHHKLWRCETLLLPLQESLRDRDSTKWHERLSHSSAKEDYDRKQSHPALLARPPLFLYEDEQPN